MDDPLAFLTRRRLLELSSLGWMLSHAGWSRVVASPSSTGGKQSIRACIVVFYYGGPSHFETWDPKPDAPAEVRGEFKPTATSVPGVQICEHLPHMAQVMHHVAIVRSMSHSARLHDSASIHALTGRPLDGPDRELFTPLPQFFPSLGSTVAYLQREQSALMPTVGLPFAFRNVHDVPCQGAGFLGTRYDPLRIEADISQQAYRVELLKPSQDLSPNRIDDRRSLQQMLDRLPSTDSRKMLYEQVYALMESPALHAALDITREPVKSRERFGLNPSSSLAQGDAGAALGYARELRGQNLLLARRLVEAGVPFVTVYDFKQQGQNWDAHAQCARQHKEFLLPLADRGLASLIEDLAVRGLLESTLVVAMGEFGRTPRHNADAGRDHWPDCYSVVLSGGGVQGGAILGASDRIGAYPARHPVTPGDLAATIFARFGYDPHTEIHDTTGRPYPLASGSPLSALF